MNINIMTAEQKKPLRILVLDGGGSKGVYTLGVLKELELKLGGTLCEHFDLIYGTSTGSIIASLIALGKSIQSIEELYFTLIPQIMGGYFKSGKSKRLEAEADRIFGDLKFDAFKTMIGIVSMNYDTQLPLIFKTNIKQAHGMKQSWEDGFGCTISEAVQSSCSAYPIFDIKKLVLSNKGSKTPVNVIDGGFIANDATLFAMIDAHKAFKMDIDQIRLLSVGCGKFIETPLNLKFRVLRKVGMVRFVERVLSANSNTNVQNAKLLFPTLKMVRISEEFAKPEYGTNMIETNAEKLQLLNQLGRKSYANFEKQIDELLNS
jgi:patatin-like phospholipase/acyl hydrolase